ncbi:hypothetical protein C8J57DRAFT_1726049 [Mycena rebaudengoi]|nr:hypothetical protein C8J57DRAFT_1726049 [Mycena rebaudengoi]
MASKPARFLSFLFSTTPAPRPPAPATPDARTRCPAFPLSPTRSRGAPAPSRPLPPVPHNLSISPFRPRFPPASRMRPCRAGQRPARPALHGAVWRPPLLASSHQSLRGWPQAAWHKAKHFINWSTTTRSELLPCQLSVPAQQISGTSKRLFCQGLEPPLFRSDLFWGVC